MITETEDCRVKMFSCLQLQGSNYSLSLISSALSIGRGSQSQREVCQTVEVGSRPGRQARPPLH